MLVFSISIHDSSVSILMSVPVGKLLGVCPYNIMLEICACILHCN